MEERKNENRHPAGTPAAQDGAAHGTAAANRHRKHKKNPAQVISGCLLYVMVIAIVSCLLGYYFITRGNDMLGLVKPSGDVLVTIEEGATLGEITDALKEAGVVKYGGFFEIYGRFTKLASKAEPGTYTLNTDMPYNQAAGIIKQGISAAKETVWVTIPEGYELRQIIELLAEKKVASEEELWETANTYQYKHEFLQDLPDRDNPLEGYLFPDTYEFYVGEDSIQVFNKMLNNFNDKFESKWKDRAAELGMTEDQVIILASMIEREAANDDERTKISAVFHNRLNSTQYPYLQSCATVQYILQERKAVLSEADTKIDSPYNTYLYKGLPIGPICSPGINSIKAALYPADVNYLFFVANGDSSLFASTYEQHLNNVAIAENNQ